MAHVERNPEPKLTGVLGDHRRTGVGTPTDDGLGLRSANFSQLGGHVGILGAIGIIQYDGNAIPGRLVFQLLAAGCSKTVRYG